MPLLNPPIRRVPHRAGGALLVVLAVCSGAAVIEAKTVVFVENGKAVSVDGQTRGWAPSEAGLRSAGKDARLFAGEGVGEGDFRVTAELTLEKLDGSAATFVLGDSHFGFATRNNELFLTGGVVLKGMYGTPIGKTADHVREGQPFTFEAARTGDRLTFTIGKQVIHERPIMAGAIGRIGLMPMRATMTIRSFRAEGNLSPQLAGYQPPLPGVTRQVEGVEKTVLLPPGPDNPRNSEGDFVSLQDGRVLFVYTHFTGGASDHAPAHLAARFSADAGRTWSDRDVVIVPREGKWNVMSVSLLRLADGRIALFYLQKNSTQDCRPVVRFSSDEAKTWSAPTGIIPDTAVDYYVLNNARVIQMQQGPHKGRLIVPVAQHSSVNSQLAPGKVTCYLSDDAGRTWRRSDSTLAESAQGKRVNLQEPGVVELKEGKLLMFIRTPEGSQFQAHSSDGGMTWSAPSASSILSPLSPASIERIPSTGDLVLAWNDHRDIRPELKGRRTPFTVAISKDDGATWVNVKVLEDDPAGWYCYTAIHFVDGHVLLGHCAGNNARGGGLNTLQITRFPVTWLYK